jgi:uncharacterized protein with HEPN domain
MKPDRAHILDILASAEFIIRALADVTFEQFRGNEEKQFAVEHQFMIMGEAVKRLSPEFRAQHPNAPWQEMAGMRDILIHSYDDVDLRIVWDAAKDHLPPLVQTLRQMTAS